MAQKATNVLETCGLPIFFKVDNPGEVGIRAPQKRKGLAVRAWVRALSFMQKEALVISDTTGLVWRLASDEGSSLNSFDSPPCSLAFFTVGGATGGTGTRGEAEPVETHLYLRTSEGDDFARDILDMGEQICFLHAFCRAELKPNIKRIGGYRD